MGTSTATLEPMSRMLETATLLRQVREAQRRFIAMWALDEHEKRVRAASPSINEPRTESFIPDDARRFPASSRFFSTD